MWILCRFSANVIKEAGETGGVLLYLGTFKVDIWAKIQYNTEDINVVDYMLLQG